MSKFSEYYASIRAKTQELANRFPDGCCLVVAGGTVAETPLNLAARLLVEGTHTLPSDEQARVFREAQELTRARTTSDPLEAARRQFGLLVNKEDLRP